MLLFVSGARPGFMSPPWGRGDPLILQDGKHRLPAVREQISSEIFKKRILTHGSAFRRQL